MQVFYHLIYEFQKGIRNLVLCTDKTENMEKIETRLKKEKIKYLIHKISKDKINVYFGHKLCLEVVETFGTTKLNELDDKQDFMLGIMLGYDRIQQCDRYLKKSNKTKQIEALAS